MSEGWELTPLAAEEPCRGDVVVALDSGEDLHGADFSLVVNPVRCHEKKSVPGPQGLE